MEFRRFVRTLTIFIGIIAAGASTPAATLKIGDPAPVLQAGKWIQGEPLHGFESNHVYVVEFWASWWAPCETSLARLNGISKKYEGQGLVAVGQDVFEKDDGEAAAFVKKLGDKITYRVALDDKSQEPSGAMAVHWMKAAGQTGVPTAFVVNRHGIIAWIGHPMALQQTVLEEILADQFDVASYAAEFEDQQKQMEREQALGQKLAGELKAQDWDAALVTVTEIENSLPEAARSKVSSIRLQILLHRKDYAGAYKLAEFSSDLWPKDAYLQNDLAWALATTEGVDKSGFAVAKKIAERANAAANGMSPGVLDTLARTQFLTGETNEAVATETKALDMAQEELKADLKRCLTDYQQGKLPEVKD